MESFYDYWWVLLALLLIAYIALRGWIVLLNVTGMSTKIGTGKITTVLTNKSLMRSYLILMLKSWSMPLTLMTLAGEKQHKITWIAIATKVVGWITILFGLYLGFIGLMILLWD